jgi:hypothetical protein
LTARDRIIGGSGERSDALFTKWCWLAKLAKVQLTIIIQVVNGYTGTVALKQADGFVNGGGVG